MKKRALIVVDALNDFCPGGALPVPHGDEVIEPINRMIDQAEREESKYRWLVVYSRDWHPAETIHFRQWPVHCVKGTHGAKFHPALKVVDRPYVFNKGCEVNEDAYSAFDGTLDTNIWDCGLCGKLNLFQLLKEAGVEEVYVGGLATDYCVKATALDSVRLGFKTYLLLDACRAVDVNPGDGDRAVEEMRQAEVVITSTQEVLSHD